MVYWSQNRLAVCHVPAKKEQMLELPPLMTNKQIHRLTAELQNQPHFQPLSHEAGQKERDLLWLWMMACRSGGKERSSTSWCLFVSRLERLELLFVFVWGLCLAALVSGERPVFHHLYLSASLYTTPPGTVMD